MTAAPASAEAPLTTGRGLTPREFEVLHWITEGKRDREIAVIVGISVRTAEHHVASILQKLAVETRTAAARMILELQSSKQSFDCTGARLVAPADPRLQHGYLYPSTEPPGPLTSVP